MKKLILLTALMLLVVPAVQAAMVPVDSSDWIGSRGTSGTDTVKATGDWSDSANGFKIAWVITQNPSGSFHYQYTLSGANGGALSSPMLRWILEVSDGASKSDFSNWNPAPNVTDPPIATWSSNGSENPYLGNDIYTIYGIRWEKDDYGGGQQGYPVPGSLVYVFTFDTFRQPIWGDFYARCGKEPGPGQPFNTAQSWGLFNGVEPGSTGWNKLDFMPVPDSQVPLPASALLLGSGLLGLGALGWRRRKP